MTGTSLNLDGAINTSETIGNLILNGTTEAPGTYNTTALAGLPGASGITFESMFGETLTIGAAVPEPGTYLGGALLVGIAGWGQRRRLREALRGRQV